MNEPSITLDEILTPFNEDNELILTLDNNELNLRKYMQGFLESPKKILRQYLQKQIDNFKDNPEAFRKYKGEFLQNYTLSLIQAFVNEKDRRYDVFLEEYAHSYVKNKINKKGKHSMYILFNCGGESRLRS